MLSFVNYILLNAEFWSIPEKCNTMFLKDLNCLVFSLVLLKLVFKHLWGRFRREVGKKICTVPEYEYFWLCRACNL